MDANKDGRLTLEEIQAFMQGARRSVPRQWLNNGSHWTVSSADAKAVGVPRRDLCPVPDGRLRRGWLASFDETRRSAAVSIASSKVKSRPTHLCRRRRPSAVCVGRFGYSV